MSTPAAPAKTPIWKKAWFWIVIGAVVVIGIIANLVGGDDPDTTAEASEDVETAAIPDVAGMPGDEARDAISDAGFTPVFEGGDEAVVKGSNWDAVDTDPAAGIDAEIGSTVTINVVRAAERLAEEQAEVEAANEERENGPVGATEAQAFCSTYAEDQLPYGVDMHWVLGKLAEEETDTGWFLKVEADVTNQYGAEESGMNIECHVSGTNSAPVMDEFLVY